MHLLTSEISELGLPAAWAQRECALTIGSFDGIHVGHQSLIGQLVSQARQQGRLSGLVTFYPHPATVLSATSQPLYLTTPGEKAALLEPFGLDWIAILPFTPELASTAPETFVRYLRDRLNMRSLWVGTDFALGRNREGDLITLQRLGQELGFTVCEFPYVTQGGEKVSSTRIRGLLRHGRVDKAARLLGRYYSVFGEVVHGAQRGRCLGFPTANIAVRPDRVVPANGIYATYAYLGSECYPSVTNVGVRPSFDNGERSVEAYLLDFDRSIYGCDLAVSFVARLRPERRFPNVQELIEQIGVDVQEARNLLDSSAREMAFGWVEKQVTGCGLENPGQPWYNRGESRG
jgi:riboflavin kinase/FMN adenylyltransferase